MTRLGDCHDFAPQRYPRIPPPLAGAKLADCPPTAVALAFLLAILLTSGGAAQVPSDSYRVETVPGPKGVEPEITAVTFGPDGKLYATFRRGYIYAFDPETDRWNRFAHGLQTPMGITSAEQPGSFYVTQIPELTRVSDTDGDGEADFFETVSDGWGLSGNYHEFIAGPVRDAEGNFYISLGLASGGAEPRPPTRMELVKKPRSVENPIEGKVNQFGHYSPVPYRGCSLKIDPDSGAVDVFSCGFRQPNGIGISPEGEIFVADNQGDWVGTSPLHHVTKGAFHGHPASLHWHPEFLGVNPVEADVAELDRKRKKPAILFPQNDMGGSVAEPLWVTTGGAFGPYEGQVLVAEWTYPRVLRADLEIVDGEYQGAAFLFVEGNGMRMGNNRMAFSPDGKALYIAQTSRIWGSVEGLQRIVYQDKVPFDILHMRLTRDGFELDFTKPVDRESASRPEAWSFTHYYYLYHSTYGSPKTDETPAKVTGVEVSEDGKKVRLTLDKLVPGRVFDLRPSGVLSADGAELCTRQAAYTLNRLK